MSPKSILLLIFIIVRICYGQGTKWEPLSTGLDRECRILFSDSVSDQLYVGGNFGSAGNINCHRIAKWNGTTFDSLGQGKNGAYVLAITNYQNQIYVGGSFTLSNGAYSGLSISAWNGNNWQDVSNTNGEFGSVIGFFEYNNELIIAGEFDSIGSVFSPIMTRFNGVRNFISFNNSPYWFPGNFAECSIVYNGEYYFGGGFGDVTTLLYDLVKFDGINWNLVGNSVNGQASGVSSMAIYHNELYIAGRFFKSNGNIGNNIMKWDGNTLSDVNNGTDDAIYSMTVFNGKLYVAGVFNNAGGFPASKIAVWDGNSWSALGPEIFDNNITTITFYKGELYAGGGFIYIDTVRVNNIAKYTGTVSGRKENIPLLFNVNVYPNPANENLHLAITSMYNEGEMQIEITDMLGETVVAFKEENFTGTFNKQINISDLSSGVYFVKMQGKEGVVVRKFVKE